MLKDYNKKEQEAQAKAEKYFGLNPGEGESFNDSKPNKKERAKAEKYFALNPSEGETFNDSKPNPKNKVKAITLMPTK